MAQKRLKRPRDPIQLGKLVVDIATGALDEPAENRLSARGRKGGVVGGKARANALTPEQRSEIAKKAAAKRWGNRWPKR